MCLAEASVSTLLCITQVIQALHLHTSLPKTILRSSSLRYHSLGFQVCCFSKSATLSLYNIWFLNPFKDCRALDLTFYFFSNALPCETFSRPKLSKYSSLPLIKGCAKQRLKLIREKTHLLSCIQVVWVVHYAVKL